MTKCSPFRHFKTSPEIIRLAVMLYIRFPLSLRHVDDLLHERGVDICHEAIGFWWNGYGPMFAGEMRRMRNDPMCAYSNWKRHLDEVFAKINVDFVPQNLSAPGTDRWVEFLRSLTGIRSINGRLGLPARVPSGPRVD